MTELEKLLAGESVRLPKFNFKTGKREWKDGEFKLKEGEILLVEGIHGLNEKMSYSLPKESKYKVYISALTCLNIDEHNRIPTTDVRLLRRMIRDNRTRGTSASGTLAMFTGIMGGLAIGLSAFFQGKVAAASADALGETGKGTANFFIAIGIAETVALFTLVFSLLLLQ